MGIFEYIGSFFGYIINLGYEISGVYVVGIILFSVAVKVLMFPTAISQQKSSIKQRRIQKRLAELKEVYKNNQQKLQEEQQKLYQKEGMSSMSGCLPMLIQFPVLIGLYQAIISPLTCVLHLDTTKVNAALEAANDILQTGSQSAYQQINFIGSFDKVRDVAAQFFTEAEIMKIESLHGGAFNLFGLDLLQTPSFANLLVLIPIVTFITSFLMMKMTSQSNSAAGSGCTNWGMPIGMSLFSTILTFSVPGAVGFYWVCTNVLSVIQSLLMNKFYSVEILSAKEEAKRYARRTIEEGNITNRYKDVDIKLVAARCMEREEERVKEDAANKKKKKK